MLNMGVSTAEHGGAALAEQAEGLCVVLEGLVRPGAEAYLPVNLGEAAQDTVLRALSLVLFAVRAAARRGEPQLRASPAVTGGRLAAVLRGVLAWALQARGCRHMQLECLAMASEVLACPALRAIAFERLEGRLGGAQQQEEEASGWQALLDDLPLHLRLAAYPMF